MARDDIWHICIDTGGTFTDCLARDPQGNLHRAKVLSSGALRGRVVEQIGDRLIRVEQNWKACDDAVAGFGFRVLMTKSDRAGIIANSPGESRTAPMNIVRFVERESVVEVDRDLNPEL